MSFVFLNSSSPHGKDRKGGLLASLGVGTLLIVSVPYGVSAYHKTEKQSEHRGYEIAIAEANSAASITNANAIADTYLANLKVVSARYDALALTAVAIKQQNEQIKGQSAADAAKYQARMAAVMAQLSDVRREMGEAKAASISALAHVAILTKSNTALQSKLSRETEIAESATARAEKAENKNASLINQRDDLGKSLAVANNNIETEKAKNSELAQRLADAGKTIADLNTHQKASDALLAKYDIPAPAPPVINVGTVIQVGGGGSSPPAGAAVQQQTVYHGGGSSGDDSGQVRTTESFTGDTK